MFCEKCGKEIPDGVKFSPSCGHDARNHVNMGIFFKFKTVWEVKDG